MGNKSKIIITAIAILTTGNIQEQESIEEPHAESSAYVEQTPTEEEEPAEEPPKQAKVQDPDPEPEPITTELNVCDTGADFASYMDFRALTDTTSAQYAIQQQAETNEDGHRIMQGHRLIAMHRQYGTAGDKLKITFQDNSQETFILGDTKANTECTHDAGNGRRSIVEIIVDTSKVIKKDINDGEINKYSQPLIKIERIEP